MVFTLDYIILTTFDCHTWIHIEIGLISPACALVGAAYTGCDSTSTVALVLILFQENTFLKQIMIITAPNSYRLLWRLV